MPGHARRHDTESVNHADDIRVLGRVPASGMLVLIRGIMDRLKWPLNEQQTRCWRCLQEPLVFLGYRMGRHDRPNGRGACSGTRPGKASVQSICRRVSEPTARRQVTKTGEDMVEKLNRRLSGWANSYGLGQVSPACRAVDAHTTRRL